jgi:hypothetical protein
MEFNIKYFFKRPIIGGIVFAVVMGLCTFTFGEISGFKARELLVHSMSGILTLCYVMILGSIYILVIILYLLSVKIPIDSVLRHHHFHLLATIAKVDTILIITAIITLLLLNIPITQTDIIPDSWYSTIYYLILAIASILGGGFISVIIMIYETITMIIHHKDGEVPNDDTEVEQLKDIEKKIEKVIENKIERENEKETEDKIEKEVEKWRL